MHRWLVIMLIFHCASVMQGQQLLNLDFEKLSAEGTARPWGWQVHVFDPNVTAQCDSVEIWHGQYSLQIQSQGGPPIDTFTYAFFIEPVLLKGNQISVTGYAKGQNFSGTAEIQIMAQGVQADSFGTISSNAVILPTLPDWSQFQIPEMTIPLEAHALFIAIKCAGIGQLWTDGLELWANGQKITSVDVADVFTDHQLDQMQGASHVFDKIHPATAATISRDEMNDLAFLGKAMSDAKIIALGESTHGTSEFFTAKHRLIQYAISELDVRLIILEDNQRVVDRINDFVLQGLDTAENVIRGLFAVWNTEEMLSLIKWIRHYNENHPQQSVEFVGMDAQNPELPLLYLADFLHLKPWQVRDSSTLLLKHMAENWRNAYYLGDSVKRAWFINAQKNYQIMIAHQDQWLADAEFRSDSFAVVQAIQNARLIMQYAEIQNTNVFEGRDKSMAENIRWHLSIRPHDTRCVVWAHDSHIARGDSPKQEDNYFLGKSMGSYLSKWYGDAYYALGLSTYHGTCLGTISYTNFQQIAFPLYTSPRGSFDEGLHQLAERQGASCIFLDFHKLMQQKLSWLTQQRPARYVGFVAEDYGFGGRYSLPHQFDGLLHIDQTTSAQSLRR